MNIKRVILYKGFIFPDALGTGFIKDICTKSYITNSLDLYPRTHFDFTNLRFQYMKTTFLQEDSFKIIIVFCVCVCYHMNIKRIGYKRHFNQSLTILYSYLNIEGTYYYYYCEASTTKLCWFLFIQNKGCRGVDFKQIQYCV